MAFLNGAGVVHKLGAELVLCTSLGPGMHPDEEIQLRSLAISACELRNELFAHELELLESLRCKPSLEGLNANEVKQLLLSSVPTCLRKAFKELCDTQDHLEADQVDWARGNAIDVFQVIAASPHVPLLSMLNAFLHLVEKKMYDALNRERLGGGYRGRPCDRTVYIDVPSWVFHTLAAPTLEAAGFRSSGGDSPTHYESTNSAVLSILFDRAMSPNGRGGNKKVKYENPKENNPFQMRSAHVTERLRELRARGVGLNLPAVISKIDAALLMPANQQRVILSDINTHSALSNALYNNTDLGNRAPAIREEWFLMVAPEHPFVFSHISRDLSTCITKMRVSFSVQKLTRRSANAAFDTYAGVHY